MNDLSSLLMKLVKRRQSINIGIRIGSLTASNSAANGGNSITFVPKSYREIISDFKKPKKFGINAEEEANYSNHPQQN